MIIIERTQSCDGLLQIYSMCTRSHLHDECIRSAAEVAAAEKAASKVCVSVCILCVSVSVESLCAIYYLTATERCDCDQPVRTTNCKKKWHPEQRDLNHTTPSACQRCPTLRADGISTRCADRADHTPHRIESDHAKHARIITRWVVF